MKDENSLYRRTICVVLFLLCLGALLLPPALHHHLLTHGATVALIVGAVLAFLGAL